MTRQFTTVYGRGLVEELEAIVHRPHLIVTMADIWPLFSDAFEEGVSVHFVDSLEREDLERLSRDLSAFESVIGLGGGQALDVAKYLSWRRRIPLFQVPTAMSVNAPFAQRAAVREKGVVRYVGWAVPEAVYVDFEVIRRAPGELNRAGVGDIFCYHTAHWDWKMAAETGNCEAKWPYDQALVDEAGEVLESVIAAANEIHKVTDAGIRTLMNAHRWGGSAFHNCGWNPRPIEGAEHFFFYSLEYLTGKHFIHGQPVCLGILLMSALQDNQPDDMREVIERVGVRYRPEEMGVTWSEVAEALRRLPEHVRRAGLWYTVASHRDVTEDYIVRMQEWLA
jgi:glycerol-1-phosphate dehydrogenase [NAD(P)+]